MSDVQQTAEKMYTTAEVAEKFGLKKETIIDWIKAGKLKAIRIGDKHSQWRIPHSSYVEFVNRRYGA